MNREIKFRGKNSKGEWIIGDLLRNRGETFIAPDGVQNPLATAEDFKVDPETVGQFTGLLDKNRREIYEGDILKYLEFTNEVSFENGCFLLKNITELYRVMVNFDVEVIDNLHDNPKLLKS